MAEPWDTVYRQAEDVVRRNIAEEVLLVPIRGELADLRRIYAVDPVGDFIWQHLDGRRSTGQIRDRVVETFDVGRETAEKDLLEFLQSLRDTGLIHRIEP